MKKQNPGNTGPSKEKDRSPKAPARSDREDKDLREPQLEGNQQGSKRPGRSDQGDMNR